MQSVQRQHLAQPQYQYWRLNMDLLLGTSMDLAFPSDPILYETFNLVNGADNVINGSDNVVATLAV